MKCVVIGSGTTLEQVRQAAQKYGQDIFFGVDTNMVPFDLEAKNFASVALHNVSYGFKGDIIFLNARDFNSSSKILPLQNKLLIVDKKDLINVKADIRNTEVLIRTKTGDIRKAKNAELQPLLR